MRARASIVARSSASSSPTCPDAAFHFAFQGHRHGLGRTVIVFRRDFVVINNRTRTSVWPRQSLSSLNSLLLFLPSSRSSSCCRHFLHWSILPRRSLARSGPSSKKTKATQLRQWLAPHGVSGIVADETFTLH